MLEISTSARLSPSSSADIPPYRLGQTVALFTNSWEWPEEIPRWSNTPCRVAVFLQHVEPKVCLLVSAFRDLSHPLDAKGSQRPLEDHVSSLERTERYDRAYWFAESEYRLFWHKDRLQRTSVSPGHAALQSLWREVGDPTSTAEWLSVRMLPRSRPSLIRFVSPTNLQWFIGL